MQKAQALYGLHIDAFLEGLATEPPKAEEFGLTEKQAKEIIRDRALDRAQEQKERKAS